MSYTSARPSRRTVARTAAWATPVLAVGAVAAPAAASCVPGMVTHAEYTSSSSATGATYSNTYTFDTQSGLAPPYGISFSCCTSTVTDLSVTIYVAYQSLSFTKNYGVFPALTAGVGTTGLQPTITAGGVTYYAYTTQLATDANAATVQWGSTTTFITTGRPASSTIYRTIRATVCGTTITDGPAQRVLQPARSAATRAAATAAPIESSSGSAAAGPGAEVDSSGSTSSSASVSSSPSSSSSAAAAGTVKSTARAYD